MSMPSEYKLLCNNLVNKVANYAGMVDREIVAKNDQLKRSLVAVSENTVEYVRTGIAVTGQGNQPYMGADLYGIGWGHTGFSWDSYFRRMAKQMKRPYVSLSYGYKTCYVRIPKLKYCDPLVTPFLLAPDRFCTQNTGFDRYATIWGFRIDLGDRVKLTDLYTGDGMQFLDDWREKCATNPDFRKALRLT